MALLRHVRRQHEHIQAVCENPEPRGAFHNADSTAADVRPGIHQPALEPIAPREPEPFTPLEPSATPAFAREMRANAGGARQRVQAMSRRARAAGPIGLGSIPGAPRPASAIPLGSILPTVTQDPVAVPRRAAPRRARPQAMAAGRPPRSAPAEGPVIEQGPAAQRPRMIEQGPPAPRPAPRPRIEQGPPAPLPRRPRAQTSGKSLRSALSRY